MLKTKKLISLVSAAVLTVSLIPSALAAEAAKVKENTFTENTFAPFSAVYGSGAMTPIPVGYWGKAADDKSMRARRYGGTEYERITINETIPVADPENYEWKYVKYSCNYLVVTDVAGDNVKTYLGDNQSTAISTEIGADKMKAGQWNHVDYVVGFQKRGKDSIRSNYEVFTYLNGKHIGTTGGNIGVNGSTHFYCDGTNALGITFYNSNKNGFNIYLDDVKFEAYTDAYNGKTTADSLIKTPAPTIDTSKANVKNGTVYPYAELNVSDITDARVYKDNTFKTQLTEGQVSVGNVIVAEKDGVIAYYDVTDIPNNYEIIVDENFNDGTLGVLGHPYGTNKNGESNKAEFVSGSAGKTSSDKVVNLIKGRNDCAVDCLQFAYERKANSYLSIDLTFMPTENTNFKELRLNTQSGENVASPIYANQLHMNRWNKIRYVIYFDEEKSYTTKTYVNGTMVEQGTTKRTPNPKLGFSGVRIGVAGDRADGALSDGKDVGNTGLCDTTYLDDVKVVEYVGTEPAAEAMPELKAIEGTKASISGIVGNFVIDGAIDVSSLTGTKGETVRAYLYDSTTRKFGEQIATVDASTSQMVVVEGENGVISYYFVQPAFSIGRRLLEAVAEFEPGYGLSPVKYTYTLKAVNNGDNDKEIYIAMGRYDKDGNLKNLTFEKGTVLKNTSDFEKQLVIDLTDDTTLDDVNDYLKLFVWDANMTPYKDAFKAQ